MTDLIGQGIAALDTPTLLVDLECFAANVARCVADCAAAGVRLRPHLKTAKSPAVARYLLAAGAQGVCVAKLGEAETLSAAGIDDLLITSEIVGHAKLARLLQLLQRGTKITAVVDSAEGARALDAALSSAGLGLDILIELDVGQGRCGVAPEDALPLAQVLATLPALRLVGLQAYEGHLQHLRDPEERRTSCLAAMGLLAQAVDGLRANGFAVPVVSTGGSGTYAFCATAPHVTEVQPGSFIFMDTDYLATGGLPFHSALQLLATVISTPRPGVAIVDAGFKSLSTDSGNAEPYDCPGWRYRPAGDEHGLLECYDAAAARPLAVGDRVALIPSHIDTTVNLHDAYVAQRGGVIAEVWPISARGKVQ